MEDNFFSEKLDLDELYEQQKITDDHKIKIYQKILGRIHNKIKHTSRIRNNNKFCMYVLPEFILGVPRYNIKTCTLYIIEKLKKNGFNIKYTYPNLLWISWQHYIPKYERANIKKKYGVHLDGFGNVIKKSDKLNANKKDTNSLLLKDKNPSLKSILKNKNKDYKQVSSYKPTGNLIYNTKLLETIDNKVLNTNKEIRLD
jgi:hypothetical protein